MRISCKYPRAWTHCGWGAVQTLPCARMSCTLLNFFCPVERVWRTVRVCCWLEIDWVLGKKARNWKFLVSYSRCMLVGKGTLQGSWTHHGLGAVQALPYTSMSCTLLKWLLCPVGRVWHAVGVCCWLEIDRVLGRKGKKLVSYNSFTYLLVRVCCKATQGLGYIMA